MPKGVHWDISNQTWNDLLCDIILQFMFPFRFHGSMFPCNSMLQSVIVTFSDWWRPIDGLMFRA